MFLTIVFMKDKISVALFAEVSLPFDAFCTTACYLFDSSSP